MHFYTEASNENIQRYFAKESDNPLAEAFSGKIAVHAGVGGKQLSRQEKEMALDSALDNIRRKQSSAYIHVPFCETKCTYCGFFNKAYRKEESGAFADLLISEIQLWSGRKAITSRPINTVYFGGGTPSALEADDMNRILKAVRRELPLSNDCEITLEGRVSNMSQEKIEAYLEGGVNRFSLGVQSFNTDIRHSVGRRSSRENIIERLELLKSYNQAAIVIDLIYGFPNQTHSIWENDVKTAISLELDGFDCYQLNVYPFTTLGQMIEDGRSNPAAHVAEKSAMFAKSVHILTDAFYNRLSINHWSRTTRERNIYNQFARSDADCIAFGPGAGGNLNGLSYMTERNYEQWKKSVANGIKPIVAVTPHDENHSLYRAISEHLEVGKLDLPYLEQKFQIPLSIIFKKILDQWEGAGLIESFANKYKLTLAGQFWYVNLAQLLLEFLKNNLNEGNKCVNI